MTSYKALYALVLGLVLWLCIGIPCYAIDRVEARGAVYDLSIRKWAELYTPEYPWYWNKAQLKAESNFDTKAKSHVGAMGLGQFMPDTWAQMERELDMSGTPYNPSLNIQAHAHYMAKLRGQFKKPRPEYDKHSLALASYNAGLGNILKAQQKANGTLLWQPTSSALCRVTGEHCKETNTYVSRIWQYIKEYEKRYDSK